MGRRRRVRPIGVWVPYVGRNWVIGGIEPASYEQAQTELAIGKMAHWVHEPAPTRLTSAPIAARFPSKCWYCRSSINEGVLIHRVRLRDHTEHWVHAACSVSPIGRKAGKSKQGFHPREPGHTAAQQLYRSVTEWTEQIYAKVQTDRVQNFGFGASVELENSGLVHSVNILSNDVVPTNLSTGLRKVLYFDRGDTPATIRHALEQCVSASGCGMSAS